MSYLNAKPLIDGLEATCELLLDVPSRLLGLMRERRADVALLPVADVPELARETGARVLRAGCIGCDGPTLTVRVFSDRPLAEVQTLYVDTDSHTSVNLARVVMRELYGREVMLVPLERGGAGRPEGGGWPGGGWPEGAVLLIGDKVMTAAPPASEKPVQVDLGEAWKRLTGLPFVFAVWTARADADAAAIEAVLTEAKLRGLSRVDEIVATHGVRYGWPAEWARRYLTEYLKFDVGPKQLEAMQLFWRKAGLGEAPGAMPE